jgi:hypothetical protein
MIGRVLWVAGMIAIGLGTAGLQLDKQSEITPALAPLVPGALRNFAQTHITAQATESGDPAQAVIEAQRLVQSRPLPAEYLSLLAVAQARAGREEEATVTIQIAGQRGWREPVAQETVLRLALAAGDEPEAARRFVALFLREKTPDDLLTTLGAQVLAEPNGAGQRTLADIVARGARWHELYLRRGAQVIAPAAFSDVTVLSIKRGAIFDCEALARVITGMQQRDPAAAKRLADASVKACG